MKLSSLNKNILYFAIHESVFIPVGLTDEPAFASGSIGVWLCVTKGRSATGSILS
jgi:hypothetical protein